MPACTTRMISGCSLLFLVALVLVVVGMWLCLATIISSIPVIFCWDVLKIRPVLITPFLLAELSSRIPRPTSSPDDLHPSQLQVLTVHGNVSAPAGCCLIFCPQTILVTTKRVLSSWSGEGGSLLPASRPLRTWLFTIPFYSSIPISPLSYRTSYTTYFACPYAICISAS
ncbi:hypothetical protein C8R45DRAFT_1090818 [Mycena sanguinolenta]|nr:hypothetical protein C8R45DRAFT_1090818 [Mycena sanguinolenta]